MKTPYPLCWPDGWKRHAPGTRLISNFKPNVYPRRRYTIDEARTGLANQLELLKATDCILSSNLRLRVDGQPMSGQAQPSDVGVAVYFKLDGRAVSLACDKWAHVECNLRAIALHIESIRGQERWGVGSIAQAFRGYMALPAVGQSGGDRYWEVLGLPINHSEEQLSAAYKTMAKKFHPDNPNTGDAIKFNQVQNAYNMLAQNLRSKPTTP